MGIIADTMEANAERTGHIFARRWESAPDFHPAAHLTCPWCPSRFPGEAELQDHVFRTHRDRYWFVLVNGRAFGSGPAEVQAPVQALRIFSSNPPAPLIEVCAQTRQGTAVCKLRRVSGYSTALEDLVPVDAVRVRLRFRQPDAAAIEAATVQLIGGPPAPISVAGVEAVAQAIQAELHRDGAGVNWEYWRGQIQRAAASAAERRYADGLLDYLYCLSATEPAHPDRRPRLKGHLDRIYGQLSGVDTPMAATARAVLDFKLNRFDALLDMGRSSIFYTVARFYTLPYEEVLAQRGGVHPLPDLHAGIWVDDFTAALITDVQLFWVKDDAALIRLVDRLEQADCPEEGDKLSLLRARLYRSQGWKEKAATAYDALKDHHLFGREARTYDQ